MLYNIYNERASKHYTSIIDDTTKTIIIVACGYWKYNF